MSEIAWAAGLFEGEGSVFIGSGQRQPVVAVVMTDEEIVRKFASVMGCGYVSHYKQRNPDHAPYWRWSVQGADDVISVLRLLMPLMGTRRRASATRVLERAHAIVRGRDLCKNGHDLTDPTHLYLHKKSGKRHCRTCRREYRKGWVLRLVA